MYGRNADGPKATNQFGQPIYGYKRPDPINIVIPDSAFGESGGGSTPFPSVETALQNRVYQLVATFSCQNFDDAYVKDLLGGFAQDQADWNGFRDPASAPGALARLVALYVTIYRHAVTVIPAQGA